MATGLNSKSRLEILEVSLEKKERILKGRFDSHFEDVKSANGQPINDKKNGQATLNRWERQSDSIRNQTEEVEKTKKAIDKEKGKIAITNASYDKMPQFIKDLIDVGTLKQWRKWPHIMFVTGVEKARIYFDEESMTFSHKYVAQIPDQKQYSIFRDVFNNINLTMNK